MCFSASESAYREYEHLKGSYAQEILCRDKAEKYAATVSVVLLWLVGLLASLLITSLSSFGFFDNVFVELWSLLITSLSSFGLLIYLLCVLVDCSTAQQQSVCLKRVCSSCYIEINPFATTRSTLPPSPHFSLSLSLSLSLPPSLLLPPLSSSLPPSLSLSLSLSLFSLLFSPRLSLLPLSQTLSP